MVKQRFGKRLKGVSVRILCGMMVGALFMGGLSHHAHAAKIENSNSKDSKLTMFQQHEGIIKEINEEHLLLETEDGLMKFIVTDKTERVDELMSFLVTDKTKRMDEYGTNALDFKKNDVVKVKAEVRSTKSAIPQKIAVEIEYLGEILTAEGVVVSKGKRGFRLDEKAPFGDGDYLTDFTINEKTNMKHKIIKGDWVEVEFFQPLVETLQYPSLYVAKRVTKRDVEMMQPIINYSFVFAGVLIASCLLYIRFKKRNNPKFVQ